MLDKKHIASKVFQKTYNSSPSSFVKYRIAELNKYMKFTKFESLEFC